MITMSVANSVKKEGDWDFSNLVVYIFIPVPIGLGWRLGNLRDHLSRRSLGSRSHFITATPEVAGSLAGRRGSSRRRG